MIPSPESLQKLYAAAVAERPQVDIRGWHYDEPIFHELIDELRPKTYIEVGCHLGASMIRVNKLASLANLDLRSYAVDFWGSQQTYDQFLANVSLCGYEHQVTPIRGSSLQGAADLKAAGVVADMIYIDAGHDEKSCYEDMVAYWPLLRKGGVMFGDDFTEEPGVANAVKVFCHEYQLRFSFTYYHWRLDPK